MNFRAVALGAVKQANALTRARAIQEREDKLLEDEKQEQFGQNIVNLALNNKLPGEFYSEWVEDPNQDYDALLKESIGYQQKLKLAEKSEKEAEELREAELADLETARGIFDKRNDEGIIPAHIYEQRNDLDTQQLLSFAAQFGQLSRMSNASAKIIEDRKQLAIQHAARFPTPELRMEAVSGTVPITTMMGQMLFDTEKANSSTTLAGFKTAFPFKRPTGDEGTLAARMNFELNVALSDSTLFEQFLAEARSDPDKAKDLATTLNGFITQDTVYTFNPTEGEGFLKLVNEVYPNLTEFYNQLSKIAGGSKVDVARTVLEKGIQSQDMKPTDVVIMGGVNNTVPELSPNNQNIIEQKFSTLHLGDSKAGVDALAGTIQEGEDATWLYNNRDSFTMSKTFPYQHRDIQNASRLNKLQFTNLTGLVPTNWDPSLTSVLSDELFDIGGGDLKNPNLNAQVGAVYPLIVGDLNKFPMQQSHYTTLGPADILGGQSRVETITRKYDASLKVKQLGGELLLSRQLLKGGGFLLSLRKKGIAVLGMFDIDAGVTQLGWFNRNIAPLDESEFAPGTDMESLKAIAERLNYSSEKLIGEIEILEFNLAVAIARSADEQGRLSNQDFEQALKQVGGGKFFSSEDIDTAAISKTIEIHGKKEEELRVLNQFAKKEKGTLTRNDAVALTAYTQYVQPLNMHQREKAGTTMSSGGSGNNNSTAMTEVTIADLEAMGFSPDGAEGTAKLVESTEMFDNQPAFMVWDGNNILYLTFQNGKYFDVTGRTTSKGTN